jgi:hypothetical protein
MGLVHNSLICGLNSIYLQAPHVKPKDQKQFCTYILRWHQLLTLHHRNEEADFFPAVEAMAGEKGIMEPNVEQHHAFGQGLDALFKYVTECQASTQTYDGARIVKMIDDFGPILVEHLGDEIPTIQGLRAYGAKMAELPKAFDEEGEKTMKALGLSGMCFFFANHNLHYENDLWLDFPPAPGVVKVACRYIFWWFHADVNKFGACDRKGHLKPLYALE